MSEILTRAAQHYADVHAPWPWQKRLHAKLAAAYAKGVTDAWVIFQANTQAMAPAVMGSPTPPVRSPVPPVDPNPLRNIPHLEN